jgi:hypothetical protein
MRRHAQPHWFWFSLGCGWLGHGGITIPLRRAGRRLLAALDRSGEKGGAQ